MGQKDHLLEGEPNGDLRSMQCYLIEEIWRFRRGNHRKDIDNPPR